ncbi:MAG: imidazoleglycerol-phosphate dehydratase HisB [Phycisphaerales bacterium]|nr:imidazoleglycerol-phosphate dehydratase HisB [Phycisphaerales bacterium]
MSTRQATIERMTKETSIKVALRLAPGEVNVSTGIGFLDHLLTALATHSRISLDLIAKGDLHIDDHHTAEDCAITLGKALDTALADRRGIARFGSAYAPLDESLARAVIDLSGRASAVVALDLRRPMIGTLACENITHFLQTLAINARAAIHLDVLRGENDHHKAEAAFKALALALRQAIAIDGDSILSTKGVLAS